MSQFSPAVGKRLMFPRSRSLLILVFNLFASCCFTFALAARFFCPDSLLDDFCPRSSPRVPPARWDGHCSPGQMIDVSPCRWRWGFAVALLYPMPVATSAFGREGQYPPGHPAPAQRCLWLLFDFTRKGIFPELLLSCSPVQPCELRPG